MSYYSTEKKGECSKHGRHSPLKKQREEKKLCNVKITSL